MVIKGQRMRLTFRASAGLWEHNAWQQLFLAFPHPCPRRLLWAMLTSQRLTPQTSMIFYKDSKHTYGPSSPPPALISHAGTHARTRTKQFCLYIREQVSPVWHHSTTAGYGSIKRPQISVDYIKTHPRHCPHHQTLFSFFQRNCIKITLRSKTLKEHQSQLTQTGTEEKMQPSKLQAQNENCDTDKYVF